MTPFYFGCLIQQRSFGTLVYLLLWSITRYNSSKQASNVVTLPLWVAGSGCLSLRNDHLVARNGCDQTARPAHAYRASAEREDTWHLVLIVSAGGNLRKLYGYC